MGKCTHSRFGWHRIDDDSGTVTDVYGDVMMQLVVKEIFCITTGYIKLMIMHVYLYF